MAVAIQCDICKRWKIFKDKGSAGPRDYQTNSWHPDDIKGSFTNKNNELVCDSCSKALRGWFSNWCEQSKKQYLRDYNKIVKSLRSPLNGDNKDQCRPEDDNTVQFSDRDPDEDGRF